MRTPVLSLVVGILFGVGAFAGEPLTFPDAKHGRGEMTCM